MTAEPSDSRPPLPGADAPAVPAPVSDLGASPLPPPEGDDDRPPGDGAPAGAARKGPTVATHYLRYVFGNVLVMIAGFVSFPIMTRLLDTGQYGIFGYYDAWLLLLLALFKLGGQHTILRFFPHKGGEAALRRYGASIVLAPFAAGCVLAVLALIAYAGIVYREPPEAATIGWFMLLLLVPTMWVSYAASIAFAEERSDISVRITVGQRWLELFSILGVVYFLERSALGAYVARLGVALVLAFALWRWVRVRLPMHWRDIDPKETRAGLRYGLPLVANEIASSLLSFADRLMLRSMTGNFASVGVYTIGYGLALNINNLLNYALYNAYTQVSVREFETLGAAAVVRTKRIVLGLLVYVTAAMITGIVAVGQDILLLMAGSDKTESALVFVLIGVNYLLDGLFGICGAGLLLHKRSASVLALTLGALTVNIVLNLILIPRFGVMGAVYATFIAYFAMWIAKYATCPRDLRAMPPLKPSLIACFLALINLVVAHLTGLFGIASHFGRFVAMALLMLPLFVLPALMIDDVLRATLVNYWRNRRIVGS